MIIVMRKVISEEGSDEEYSNNDVVDSVALNRNNFTIENNKQKTYCFQLTVAEFNQQ